MSYSVWPRFDQLVSRAGVAQPLGSNQMTARLSATMTVREFENGYWYADELRDFAQRLAIPGAARLRKDELEQAIVTFLRTGKLRLPTKRALRKTGIKDVDRGLSLGLRIQHYTSNRATKDFIVREARKSVPDVREKSGVWYRLNRWREAQITNGKNPTYRDLIQQYIALNKVERFEKIPQDRYINFVAEFLANEKGAGRADAIAAWGELKIMNVPKNYWSYRKARMSTRIK
jgi:SAP domain-containing protein